jgi:hypothetical protein
MSYALDPILSIYSISSLVAFGNSVLECEAVMHDDWRIVDVLTHLCLARLCFLEEMALDCGTCVDACVDDWARGGAWAHTASSWHGPRASSWRWLGVCVCHDVLFLSLSLGTVFQAVVRLRL